MNETNTSTSNWEEIKQMLEEYNKKYPLTVEKAVCPHCGYCPHCGRGDYYGSPYRPYWAPYTTYLNDNIYKDGHTVTCNHG